MTSINDIINFFKNSNTPTIAYKKNSIIALEGDTCDSVGLVVKGSIEIKKILNNDNTILVSSLSEGDFFGEIIAFSDINTYPSTVLASTNCEIIFITKDKFINFCISNPDFLVIFLNDLSNKIIKLNQSVNYLGLNNIRKKVCHYILNEYKSQNTNFININMTKSKLSQVLGIPRTSLSRELTSLKELDLIDYSKDYIKILNINEIEKMIYN